ncbi:MAG: alpha-2-macroglobulin family protein, partial [Mucilaginibacter sp.]
MENLYSRFRSRQALISFGVLIILLTLAVFMIFRHRQKPGVDPEFSKYIESYTTGMISKGSTIKIRLASDVQVGHEQNAPLSDDIFSFSPAIKGKAYWIDARTIEFRPDGTLDPDKSYTAEFSLKKIINVDSKFEEFKFGFQTIKPDYTVTFTGLQTATNTSLDKMKLGGVIQTADDENSGDVEKIITANFTNPVAVTWQHNPITKTHHFTVNQLSRGNGTVNKLTVNWDGSGLNIDRKGTQEFAIPALGDFKVLDI